MLEILYEDNHLLAVNKPAMLATMGVDEGVPSLLTVAKEYVRRKYNKPGNVYLGIVSRLDAPVTGVVLMARTSKAAGRLSEQFREREVGKTYWALVEGGPEPPRGRLIDFLRKDERHRRVHATVASAVGAQEAVLDYEVIACHGEQREQACTSVESTAGRIAVRSGGLSLVEVHPLTGRKHQIRVQLSQAGNAIVGDQKYGSTRPFPRGIALHSRRLEFTHPVGKMQLVIEAPLPASWQRFIEVR